MTSIEKVKMTDLQQPISATVTNSNCDQGLNYDPDLNYSGLNKRILCCIDSIFYNIKMRHKVKMNGPVPVEIFTFDCNI